MDRITENPHEEDAPRVEISTRAGQVSGERRLRGYQSGDRTPDGVQLREPSPIASATPSQSLLDRVYAARSRFLERESDRGLTPDEQRNLQELEDEIDRLEAIEPESDARSRFYEKMTALASRVAAITEPTR